MIFIVDLYSNIVQLWLDSGLRNRSSLECEFMESLEYEYRHWRNERK